MQTRTKTFFPCSSKIVFEIFTWCEFFFYIYGTRTNTNKQWVLTDSLIFILLHKTVLYNRRLINNDNNCDKISYYFSLNYMETTYDTFKALCMPRKVSIPSTIHVNVRNANIAKNKGEEKVPSITFPLSGKSL